MLEDRDGEQNKPPVIQEEAVNDLLCHLDTSFMGPDGIHLCNVMPIYKNRQKEDPRNYRPASRTSVMMHQFSLSVLTRHVKDSQGFRPSQHGFTKGSSCLTNLTSFYDQVTCLADEGKAVDVIYLDSTKASDIVPHSTLLEKLAAHGSDGCTLHWIKNRLNG